MITNWDEGTSTLIAHALPVIRVTKSDEGNVTITWRHTPTDDERAKATSLISGVVPTHAW